MIEIDVKKTHPMPKDQWDAIDYMNKAQSELLQAIHILCNVVEWDDEDQQEINKRRAKEFIKKYIK